LPYFTLIVVLQAHKSNRVYQDFVSSHLHHGVNFMKMKPGILGYRILEKQKKRFSMHYNYNKTS